MDRRRAVPLAVCWEEAEALRIPAAGVLRPEVAPQAAARQWAAAALQAARQMEAPAARLPSPVMVLRRAISWSPKAPDL
jgi:hypothetical protein